MKARREQPEGTLLDVKKCTITAKASSVPVLNDLIVLDTDTLRGNRNMCFCLATDDVPE